MSESRVLKARCQNCNAVLRVKTKSAEKTVTCPKCNAFVSVSDATDAAASVPTEPVASPLSARLDIGERNRCPKCGSDKVRAMSQNEMREFYGGNLLVLTPARKCKACGHGYETRPSRGGCKAIMFFSVVGALFGLGILVTAIVMVPVVIAGAKAGGNSPLWPVLGCGSFALSAVGIMYGSGRAFGKYRRYLSDGTAT